MQSCDDIHGVFVARPRVIYLRALGCSNIDTLPTVSLYVSFCIHVPSPSTLRRYPFPPPPELPHSITADSTILKISLRRPQQAPWAFLSSTPTSRSRCGHSVGCNRKTQCIPRSPAKYAASRSYTKKDLICSPLSNIQDVHPPSTLHRCVFPLPLEHGHSIIVEPAMF